jgi:hypothetical protein
MSNAGQVFVLLGVSTGSFSSPTVIEGSSADAVFGLALSGVGDWNNDGFCDMVVGAPGTTVATFRGAGAAYAFLGSAMGLERTASRAYFGRALDDLLGLSLGSGAGF